MVQCHACGGNYSRVVTCEDGRRYRTHFCAWCTLGAMTVDQLRAWKNRPKGKTP